MARKKKEAKPNSGKVSESRGFESHPCSVAHGGPMGNRITGLTVPVATITEIVEVDELDEWMALLKMNLQQVTQESQKLMEPV